MREELIRLLYYPMSLVHGRIDLDKCVHGGSFDREDEGCARCTFATECDWLNKHDQFSQVTQKTEQELAASLSFAQDYVSAFTTLADHNARACMCEACRWLRKTRRVLQAME